LFGMAAAGEDGGQLQPLADPLPRKGCRVSGWGGVRFGRLRIRPPGFPAGYERDTIG
jgi:hypothetical protein